MNVSFGQVFSLGVMTRINSVINSVCENRGEFLALCILTKASLSLLISARGIMCFTCIHQENSPTLQLAQMALCAACM